MIMLPEDLFDTLPPERVSEDCGDGDFTCGHWVHRTQHPEANAVLAPAFDDFLRAKHV
mgnify:FL=1